MELLAGLPREGAFDLLVALLVHGHRLIAPDLLAPLAEDARVEVVLVELALLAANHDVLILADEQLARPLVDLGLVVADELGLVALDEDAVLGARHLVALVLGHLHAVLVDGLRQVGDDVLLAVVADGERLVVLDQQAPVLLGLQVEQLLGLEILELDLVEAVGARGRVALPGAHGLVIRSL